MSEREYVDEVYLYRTKLREIPVSTVKNYIERKALEEYQQLYRELDEAQEEFAKLQTRIKELHTDRNTQRIVVEHYIEMAQYKERTIAAYKQRLLQYEEKKELKDIYFRATHPNQPIERNNTNGKLRTVMLITLIIGIIATVMSYCLGLPAGLAMARKKDKLVDKLGPAYIMFIIVVMLKIVRYYCCLFYFMFLNI